MSRLSLFAAAAAAAAISAAPAGAAPYEQVNRATGANGDAPLQGWSFVATAVGDVGRYAGFERRANVPDAAGAFEFQGLVRDIQTNTTYNYGGGVQRIFGIDRAERRALILRTRSGQQQVVAVPIAGGAPLIIATFPADGFWPEAVLSGDGRKVVVSRSGFGTKLFDLTGGVTRLVRQLSTRAFDRFTARAVDDTASAVVGYDDEAHETVLLRGGTERVLFGGEQTAAAVDPSGTSVAWAAMTAGGVNEVTLRTLASGVERRFRVPNEIGGPAVAWVAAGGAKVAVAGSGYFENSGAQAVTTATGAWAKFGDRFASTLAGGATATPVSATGRFALPAVSTYGGALTLVNLSGQHIVGANEGFAPSANFVAGTEVALCTQPATFTIGLIQPAVFAPAPKKAVVTAKADGAPFLSGTLTAALPWYAYLFRLPEDPASVLTGTYPAPYSVGDIQLTVTLTDGAGRVTTNNWTYSDDCE